MLLVRPFHSRYLTHGGSTYRDRFYGQRELVIRPWPWGLAFVGLALFWAGDSFATGMIFTRRTGPLAGAGLLALVLPLTIPTSLAVRPTLQELEA